PHGQLLLRGDVHHQFPLHGRRPELVGLCSRDRTVPRVLPNRTRGYTWSVPSGVPRMMQLRPYQTEAVNFLLDKGSAVLALDRGLGKTAISLSALTPGHLPVLVTAPPRPVESVWPAETEKWRPDLTC